MRIIDPGSATPCFTTLRRVALIMLLLTRLAEAQSNPPDSSRAHLHLVSELGRLPLGTVVRVRISQAKVTGRIDSLSLATIAIRSLETRQSLSLWEIDSLWVKRRNTGKFAHRAMIGTAAIIGTTVVIGSLVGPKSQRNGEYALAGVIGTGLYAATGWLVGAVIGSMSTNWELRHP